MELDHLEEGLSPKMTGERVDCHVIRSSPLRKRCLGADLLGADQERCKEKGADSESRERVDRTVRPHVLFPNLSEAVEMRLRVSAQESAPKFSLVSDSYGSRSIAG